MSSDSKKRTKRPRANEDKGWWDRWLNAETARQGRHFLTAIEERNDERHAILESLREVVRTHYLDPAISEARLKDLGAPATGKLLREHYPRSKKARSGDVGEILATEVSERQLRYSIPVRRLRWKDGREMALRGDDLIGVKQGANGKLQFLKGEAKSRASLTNATLKQAGIALDRNRGRPARHGVLFVAERLRERGQDELAKELEEALLNGFRGSTVEHLVFAVSGNDSRTLLRRHLASCVRRRRTRHAIGIHIADHAGFIKELFDEA